jgi:hypothetical protein
VSVQLVKAAATISRLQRSAREALRAVRELERTMDADMFGSYVIEADEELDEDIEGEIVDLLRLARETYPTQEIELVVIARSA